MFSIHSPRREIGPSSRSVAPPRAKLEAVCRKGFTPISPFELHLTLRRLERLGEITRCKFFGDTITIVWLDALDKACTQEEE